SRIVFDSIDALREDPSGFGRTNAAAPVAPDDTVRSHLEKLETTLAAGDLTVSLDLLKKLKSTTLNQSNHDEIGKLEEMVHGYEYEQAAVLVNRLLHGLQGKK